MVNAPSSPSSLSRSRCTGRLALGPHAQGCWAHLWSPAPADSRPAFGLAHWPLRPRLLRASSVGPPHLGLHEPLTAPLASVLPVGPGAPCLPARPSIASLPFLPSLPTYRPPRQPHYMQLGARPSQSCCTQNRVRIPHKPFQGLVPSSRLGGGSVAETVHCYLISHSQHQKQRQQRNNKVVGHQIKTFCTAKETTK